jgi:hypothetical protein
MGFRFLPAVAIAFLTATSAHALSTTFSGTSCSSCDGSEVTLEIVDNGGTFDVTLSLDSTNYDESREGIAQVGFGGIRNWTSVALIDSPAGSAIAWSDPVESNISSSGLCSVGGSTDKVCTSGFTDLQTDQVYVWKFVVTGGILQDVSEWHIGGQYADLQDLLDDNAQTPHGKVMSESGSVSPVPEPSAPLIFGLGIVLSGLGIRTRR